MNWRSLISRFHGRPHTLESDLDEELAFHRELKERALRQSGLTESEARTAARKALGNLTLAREDARAAWRFTWLADLTSDLRYGSRGLLRQPGFTLPAVLALTVGLGLNGLLFTIYNALALAPWAVRDAASTVQLLSDRGGRWGGLSWPEYQFLAGKTKTLAALTAWDDLNARVTDGAATWQADAIIAAPNYFGAIGAGFLHGRAFQPASPELVLHHEAWQRRFAADPAVLGRWIDLNGRRLQIVGVAAPGFSGASPLIPDLWISSGWARLNLPGARDIDDSGACCAHVIGRLNSGIARAAARDELSALSAQYRETIAEKPSGLLLTTPSLLANPTIHAKTAPAFLLLAIASTLVLLLACANVGNLLLARAAVRRREIAVRLSLGAGRTRLLRQLTAEGLLLACIAGLLTLALAAVLPQAIVTWVVDPEDRIALTFTPDARVAAFVLAASLLTTLLFTLAPARHAIRDGVESAALCHGARAGARGNRLRTLLLTAQLALCATLLCGASLLLRAAQTARAIHPGFRHHDVILVNTGLASSGAAEDQTPALIEQLRERLAALPGVTAVAHSTVVPLGSVFNGTILEQPRSGEPVRTGVADVSAGYFELLDVPLQSGRAFTRADESRTDVALVNQALAARMWPGESAVGKTFPWMRRAITVVGVVANLGTRELGHPDEPSLYFPSRGGLQSILLVRSDAASLSPLLSALPDIARETDPRFFPSVSAYSGNVDRQRRSANIAASMASTISGVALLLAFIGLYGVASYQLQQRTREIGVRMALGAQPRQILRLMTAQSLRPVLAGALLGIAGALALGRLLTSMLYGVSPADPLAVSATASLLALTAVIAIAVPAARATTVNPADTLRHD